MTQIFDLGKLRFHFKGVYSPTVQYELNDVVKFGGGCYVYTHVLKGTGTSPANESHWGHLSSGTVYQGAYNKEMEYAAGDIVSFGANSYICVQRSTGEFPTNAAKFGLLTVGSGVPGVWDARRADYAVNEQVTYGALTYKVVAGGFAAAGVIPEGSNDWALVAEGTAFTGAFVAGTKYKKGDLAMYGPNTFRRTATGVSANFVTDKAAGLWVDHTYGIRWMGVVQPGVTYHPGEVVSDYTNSYICKKTTTAVENQDFSSAGNESSDWDIVSRGQEYFPHPVPADYGSVIASTVEGGFLLTRQSVAVDADTQAVIYQHLFVDTNAKEESIVITLPVANEFSRGISVTITDVTGYADVYPIIIKTPDGARIEGQDDAEFHIDAAFGSFKLVFFNTTQGWKVL